MYRQMHIAVVVPAYNEARLLPRTLDSMPAFVDDIIVVDDASTDDTVDVARRHCDARVDLVEHTTNGGVGAAIVTGYRRALELGADAVAVMAADAQMDPADLPVLLDALVDEDADYVKGDRLAFPGAARTMPPLRWAGTMVLGYLTRLPSGFGDLRDSQCGYTAIRASLLERLPLDALYPRYGFPNDLLNRVGEAGGSLVQRPVRPVYADEQSGLRISRVILPISRILAAGMWRRVRRAPAQLRAQGGRSLTPWLVAALCLGTLAGAAVDPLQADEQSDTVADAQARREALVARLRNAVETIDEHYVEPVDTGDLIYRATYGAVATLDHNSKFLPPRDYDLWHNRIHGRATGPGFEVRLSGGHIVIQAISPDSPASRADLRDGDRLIAIDDEKVAGLGVSDIHARLRGDEGTRLIVRYRPVREGKPQEPVEVELTREKVRAVPVVSRVVDGDIAWIEVRSFQEGATADVDAAVTRLSAERETPLRGLVLDLRGNLGGLLDEGIELADLFLPGDKVVVSLERRGETLKVHKTVDDGAIELPMVVLVNARSASASELFAAALRDHGRARLVGSQTYGKGSVQSTYPLADGSGLKITTSRYLTATAEAIDGIGISPDIGVRHHEQAVAGLDDIDDGLLTALDVLREQVDAPAQTAQEPAAP